MAISDCEEVAVFHAAEMGNRNPSILVLFVGVGWGLSSLCGKREFSDTVGKHLLWVCRVETVCKLLHLGKRQGLRELLLLLRCDWGFQGSGGGRLMGLGAWIGVSSLHLA